MDNAEIIGTIATIIGSFSCLPQMLKAYRVGSAKEISITYLGCHFISNILWIAFGVLIYSPTLLSSVSLSTFLDLIWFYNMFKDYRRNKGIEIKDEIKDEINNKV